MTKFFPWFYEGEGSYCYNLTGFITTTAHFHAEIKKIIYNWRFTGSGDIHHVHDIHIWGLDMTPYLAICKARILMTTHTPSDSHLLPTHRASPPHNTSITPPATTASQELLLHTTAIYSSPNQYTVGPYYRYNWWAATVFPICHRLAALSSATVWGPLIQDSLLFYWAILSSLRVQWYIK